MSWNSSPTSSTLGDDIVAELRQHMDFLHQHIISRLEAIESRLEMSLAQTKAGRCSKAHDTSAQYQVARFASRRVVKLAKAFLKGASDEKLNALGTSRLVLLILRSYLPS